MTYYVEEFKEVDEPLQRFMDECSNRGLVNNATIEKLNLFKNEPRNVLFMLKKDDTVIGTFGAHTLDLFENAYRICARACILTDQTEHSSLRTVNQIRTHQNVLARYGLDACIKWVNDPNANLYISTHPSDVGAMKLMHRIVLPVFEKTGLVERVGDFTYKKNIQTFWKVNPAKYYEQIQ